MDNLTAKVSCFARAYHNRFNTTPIFADSAAEAILGKDYNAIAESMAQGVKFFLPGFEGTDDEGLRIIVDKQLSPSVLGRSAYCEKMLETEMRLGCMQYIIFAAGYDTYAIRNNCERPAVYELDLPDVLEDKERRIKQENLNTCAVNVPCDLSDKIWADKLIEKGFDTNKKTFASLLGISYYLEVSEWEQLICAASKIMPKGSAICFDYPSKDESKETQTNKMLASGAGEKMKALYHYSEMEALLSRCGFNIYEHLDHEEMDEQYFTAYNKAEPDHPIAAPTWVNYILAVKI